MAPGVLTERACVVRELNRMSFERVVVIGTSCCGKTTFARRLSDQLGGPHVELDALYWGPDWVPTPPDEFRRRVEQAVTEDRWVIDGNYSAVRDLVWPRATAVIWLNFGFALVFGRALVRTTRRVMTREKLFAGNRESLRRSLLDKDSILLWVISTYGPRRREYRDLCESGPYSQLQWIEFRTPAEAEDFLK